MEENKLNKKNKGKYMTASVAPTIRGLVDIANNLNILKEDIVSLMKEAGQYILIYYKN